METQLGGMIGLLLGGMIAAYLVYGILHWCIISRLTNDRQISRVSAALAAYPVSVVLYGFGAADVTDGSFNLDGIVIYIIPTLVISASAYLTGKRERLEVRA